jgi:prolyl oligopeptidase
MRNAGRFLFLLGTLNLLVPVGLSAGTLPLPSVPTPTVPVTNTYHGVAVVDDYRWLENTEAPAVRSWSQAQNARTHQYFNSLSFRDGVAQQLNELLADESASYGLGDKYGDFIFGTRFKPPQQQPVLVRFKSIHPPALRQVVFDPNAWNTNGTTAMDWWVPSPDGKYVAICLSENGSENGVLHFVETATGKLLPDVIPGVQFPTGGGSAAWNADASEIFYTRYPHPGERAAGDEHFYQQIWRHKLGTPISADTCERGRDYPRIAEIELDSSRDGRWLLATIANGDGGDYALQLRSPDGVWHDLAGFADGIKHGKFGPHDTLYLLSKKNAPRGKILALSLSDLKLAQAKTVVPESTGVIADYTASATGLYVSVMDGGPSRLWFYPQKGSPVEVPILPVSSVGGLQCWQDDTLVFGNSSFVKPNGWYEWQPGMKLPRATAFQMTSPANFDDLEVVREFAISKDGTRIPISILHKKGIVLDGHNPTLLTGYGGYGVSLTPGFSSTRRVWFDAGGVFAVANLRGGGEYGEAWHLAGNLTHKQHVFDDFIACAEHLIQRHYTSTNKLAVMGSSNGGLLMGAFLTQRPDLARAVVSRVGIYDMLRVEQDANGVFNITEFDTVTDTNQFKALYAYSPYQHVTNGVAYPSVLFPCGETDGRVNPAHSRKMTARLQTATAGDHPILLRLTATAGHGMGSSLKDKVAEQTDIYSFLFQELGIDTTPWQVR